MAVAQTLVGGSPVGGAGRTWPVGLHHRGFSPCDSTIDPEGRNHVPVVIVRTMAHRSAPQPGRGRPPGSGCTRSSVPTPMTAGSGPELSVMMRHGGASGSPESYHSIGTPTSWLLASSC